LSRKTKPWSTAFVPIHQYDKSKPFTIKPFKAWMNEGRMVRKGEHGIRGLFHVSQTDPVVQAKPAPKGKAKPKPKLTPVH
jgi:hypothetical protein